MILSKSYDEIKKEREYNYNLLLDLIKNIKEARITTDVDHYTSEAIRTVLCLRDLKMDELYNDCINCMGR